MTEEHILAARKARTEDRIPEGLKNLEWERGAVNMYHVVKRFLGEGAVKAQELLVQKAEENVITRSSVGAWMSDRAGWTERYAVVFCSIGKPDGIRYSR